MSMQRLLKMLGMAAALAAFTVPMIAQNDSDVVAEIGDRKITEGELEHSQAGKLLQARYKFYVAQQEALEQLITEQLLDMQAKKEGLTVEELIKRHISTNVPDPTEDQLRFYYEGVQTEEPYESARPHIVDTIHQLRMKKAREAYITQLRGDFRVVLELAQPSAQVEVADAPRLGPANAPVQIVEFADYECPYCQQVNTDLKRLQEQFGTQVSIVYKDFPLPMHNLAQRAAEGARCAGAQGKFWEFHDFLFDTKKVQTSPMKEEARTLKLDGARFDKCLDSGEETAVVKKDAEEGRRLGIQGTPSFFINGHFMSGAVGYGKLRESVLTELGNSFKKQNSAALIQPSASENK
jgi:protein-disulfide isomerase